MTNSSSNRSNSNSKIEIRPYNAETDLIHIERMGQQTVDDGTVFPFRNLQGVKDYWFGVPGASIFVAQLRLEENNNNGSTVVVVGSYVIKPVMPDRMSHVANAGYMVDVSYRNLGIGKKLAADSICQCTQLGYRGIQFNAVVSTNTAAIHLWKTNFGFVQIGTIPQGFQIDDDSYVDITIWYRSLITEKDAEDVEEE